MLSDYIFENIGYLAMLIEERAILFQARLYKDPLDDHQFLRRSFPNY